MPEGLYLSYKYVKGKRQHAQSNSIKYYKHPRRLSLYWTSSLLAIHPFLKKTLLFSVKNSATFDAKVAHLRVVNLSLTVWKQQDWFCLTNSFITDNLNADYKENSTKKFQIFEVFLSWLHFVDKKHWTHLETVPFQGASNINIFIS